MQIFLFSALFLLLLTGCDNPKIVRASEVTSYLSDENVLAPRKQLESHIDFWKSKLSSDTTNFVYRAELAGAYQGYFRSTGNISYLTAAEQLLTRASASLRDTDPQLLQSLAQLSITEHQFLRAVSYNEEAKRNRASPVYYHLIAFDAAMEIGQYAKAGDELAKVRDNTSFHYLVRKSKLLDQQGDLDGAITTMEEAFRIILPGNNRQVFCWALSNLADMYGHAGRIEDAYRAYKTVLAKDPGYIYALKGIAWIAYSHDKDPALAEQIVSFIMKHDRSPDHYLLLAEICRWKGDEKSALLNERLFLEKATDSGYKTMYSKYLIHLYSDRKEETAKAVEIAGEEVKERPTPETFSWLAWAYYRNNELKKAITIYNNHVKGRTFEPEAILTGAYILKAAGKGGYEKLYNESKESSFELGPVAIRDLADFYSKN